MKPAYPRILHPVHTGIRTKIIRRTFCNTNDFNHAKNLFLQGKIAQATKIYESIHEKEPTNPAITRNLATCYRVKGRINDALQLLLKPEPFTTQNSKQPPNVWNSQIGFLYLLNGEKEKARPYFSYGDNFEREFGQGIFAYQEGRFPEAITLFENALGKIENSQDSLTKYRIQGLIEDAKNLIQQSEHSLQSTVEDFMEHLDSKVPTVVSNKDAPSKVENFTLDQTVSIGEGVTISMNGACHQEGQVSIHNKEPGEFVAEEDTITYIETDKVMIDVNAREAGLIASVLERNTETSETVPIYHIIPQTVREVQESGEASEPHQPPKPLSPKELVDLILRSTKVVAVTGAGISSASGLETRKQLWTKLNREEYVSIWQHHKDPSKLWNLVYDFLKPVNFKPQPNIAHTVLARLEQAGIVRGIITQNVDNLHQLAGSKRVVEMHGSLSHVVCNQCDVILNTPCADYLLKDYNGIVPQCSAFNSDCCLVKNDSTKQPGNLKPNVVLFGELVPASSLKEAMELALECDLMIIVGTSMDVYPTCELPRVAKSQKGKNTTVVEIKRKESRITKHCDGVVDYVINSPSSEVFEEIWQHFLPYLQPSEVSKIQ